MARLAVRLLGPFEVTLDGKPAAGFRSDKVRALLAYLCIETAGPHRRERLAGLLWPDLPEGSARTNLRHALANLRQVIGDRRAAPEFLSITAQTIQLNTPGSVWSDAAAVSHLLSAGPPRIHHMEQAAALYRGDLLEGFSLPDSPLFEEWALLHRERLLRLVLDALFFLARSYEQRADYERALPHAWRQVELEPWREAAHRQVMRLLAQSSQRAAALAQFETCRRLLAGELGVEPDAETAALYEQIQSGAFPRSATGEAHPPPHSTAPLRVHNVPVPLTPLVGREAELAEIEHYLGDPACRLLTLVGCGGVGKTHLALEATRPLASRYADGVFFVAAAPLRVPGELVPAVAQAVGLAFHEGESPRQQLLGALRGKEALLLLDSFEHLLACPEADRKNGLDLLTATLETAPGLRILVTSRNRLGLRAEQILPLEGLGDDQAVRLFLLGARRARPAYGPSPAELAEIGRICRLVGGLPLAILMAAAWVRILDPAEIAAHLCGQVGESLDFLTGDWHDLPDRQRSLRAVFDYSWALLSQREREVLQGLSACRGGFSRQAAQAVAGAALPELRALADQSLLRYTSAQRYDLHDLLRQYAAEKLGLSGPACEDAHARHSAYYGAVLGRAREELKGPRQQAVLAELEIDGENLRAAWNWAVAHKRIDLVARAMGGLSSFYWSHGRYQDGEAALGLVMETLGEESGGGPEVLRVLARALVWQGNFRRLLGWSEPSGRLLLQSSALMDRLELAGEDTRRERAFLFWTRGHAAFKSDYGQARQLYGQSLDLYRALGNRWGMANALSSLGRVAIFCGDIGEAGQRLEESLAIRQALGDPRGSVSCMADLAEVKLLQGRFDEAEGLARDSHARCRKLSNRAEAAYGLLVWGETLEAVGQFVPARERLIEGLAHYEELRHDHYISYAHAVLGTIEMHQAHYDRARDHAQTGLALARQARLPYRIGANLLALGGVALAQGAYAEADALLQECVSSYEQIGQQADRGWATALWGYASRGLGDVRRARHHLRDALLLGTRTGSILPSLWALPAIALLLADEDKLARAVELYALACRHALVSRSAWFEQVAGERIAESAANLSPESIAAAQEGGRARDWERTMAELAVELAD